MGGVLRENNALTYALVQEAERIYPFIWQTPEVRSDYLSELTGGEVTLKLESLQRLKAFKIRGMLNRILTMDPIALKEGITVASSGNFAIAASYCGHAFDIPVTVFVPYTTPETKLRKIHNFGATVRLSGKDYDECLRDLKSMMLSQDIGGIFIDQSDPYVVAGYGTLGSEMANHIRGLQEVVLPVGGGNLMAGVGVALKSLDPSIKVLGVQTESCPAMVVSLREGRPYTEYASGESSCEALIGGVDSLAFDYIKQMECQVFAVSERSILRAVRYLLMVEKVLAEPSAAVGVAYVLDNPTLFYGKNVAVVISGGNIDLELLRGLASEPSDEFM